MTTGHESGDVYGNHNILLYNHLSVARSKLEDYRKIALTFHRNYAIMMMRCKDA